MNKPIEGTYGVEIRAGDDSYCMGTAYPSETRGLTAEQVREAIASDLEGVKEALSVWANTEPDWEWQDVTALFVRAS